MIKFFGWFVAFVVGFSVAVLYSLLFAVPAAWLVMLILGAFHASFASVPALSFWLTLIGLFAVRLVMGFQKQGTSGV